MIFEVPEEHDTKHKSNGRHNPANDRPNICVNCVRSGEVLVRIQRHEFTKFTAH